MTRNKAILLGSLFILLIAATRLLPHPFNFTPVGALAYFGGAVYGGRKSFLFLTLAALFLTDLLINNTLMRPFFEQEGIVWFSEYMIWVYASFAMMFFLAFFLLKKFSYSKLFLTAAGGSFLFYLITNFGAWLGSPLYSQDMAGLISSYLAGLPFYKFTLLGDVLYAFILFGVYHRITAQFGIKNLILQTER